MKLVLIAAVGSDRAIGRGNDLLFRDPQDQKHLRAATMGHPVIMGRRTWLSLPERFRPLPGRRNIVLSRDAAFAAAGAEVAPSLDAARALVAGAEQAFVLGGAEIYDLALPHADELLLTEVERSYPDADCFFPDWPRAQFEEVERAPASAADGTAFAFVRYRRQR
jgi:dihydrofolate reductase